MLGREHVDRYVAEVRRKERMKLPAYALRSRADDTNAIVTPEIRRTLFNGARKVLRAALETGACDRLGLAREFVVAIPPGGQAAARKRSPFPDEVARALADETNLRRLADLHDPADRGMRDIWEAIVSTGRRPGLRPHEPDLAMNRASDLDCPECHAALDV